MKKVIKHPKKMKNAMYIVFGVFALALFAITRIHPSYANDGLMIDDALDAIVLYGEVDQLPEDEEVEEVQDEEIQEIEKNQEVEEEDIAEPEETSDEEIDEEETSEDLDETVLERDNKGIDGLENGGNEENVVDNSEKIEENVAKGTESSNLDKINNKLEVMDTETFTVSFDTRGGSTKDSIMVTGGLKLESKIIKYSHTSNVLDDGTQNGNYGVNYSKSDVVYIPGAENLQVTVVYGGDIESNRIGDFVYVVQGDHPEYSTFDYSKSISGKLGGGSHLDEGNRKTYEIEGDTVTFVFNSDSSSEVGDGYGYYAIVEGTGFYVGDNPTKNEQIFDGWYKDEDLIERWNYDETVDSDVVLYAKWRDPEATFLPGNDFNKKVRTFVNGTLMNDSKIKQVLEADSLPSGTSILVSDEKSETPIYAWFDANNGILYYYTDASAMYFNYSVSNMFAYMASLETVDLSNIRTDRIKESGSMFWSVYGNSDTSLKTIYSKYEIPSTGTDARYTVFGDAGAYIVGGNGTKYSSYNSNWEYAKPDTKAQSGYFTDPREITVNFKVFGELYGDQVVAKGGIISRPTNPEIQGYDFEGWYTDENFTTGFDFSQGIEKYTEVYARMDGDEAILLPGKDFNLIIKKLANSYVTSYTAENNTIKAMVRTGNITNEIINSSDTKLISTNYSKYPIYAWYRNEGGIGTIYYYTQAPKIYMNIDSSYMFYYMNELKELDVSNFDTSRVTDMSFMFYGPYNNSGNHGVETLIGLETWDTSNVTTMYEMFAYNTNLTGIDISTFDMSSLENMNYMFYHCDNLRTVNASNIKNIITMNDAFDDCGNLETVIMDNCDMSNLYTWRVSVFYRTPKLETISMKGCKLPKKIEYFGDFIGYGNNVKTIDATDRDLSNLESMYMMLYGMGRLEKVIGIEDWDTSNVIDMYGAFRGTNLQGYLDLSRWDVGNVENMYEIFRDSTLSGISISGWKLDSIKNMKYMFQSSKLKEVNMSNIQINNAEEDTGTSYSYGIMYGMFQSCNNLEKVDMSNSYMGNGTKLDYLFQSVRSLKEVNFENTDFSNVKGMYEMFQSCGLTGINMSGWRLDNVEDMRYMFQSSNVKEVNMSNMVINPEGNTNLYGIFFGCNSLENVNMNNTDMRGVTDFAYLFQSLAALKSVDMSNVKVDNLTGMYGMFMSSPNVETVNFSGLDTSKVKNMGYIFQNAYKLKEIIGLEGFDTSSVESMIGMFYGLKAMTGLDLSNFDTRNVKDMRLMLYNAENLETVYVGKSFNTDNVVGTGSENMFSGAISLVGGKGTTFDENHIDKEYAKIDALGDSGYFTQGEFNIEYNLDGGELENKKTSYKIRESFTIQEPVREEAVFLGWTGSNGDVLQKEINIQKGTTGDLEFTANWKANQYKIIFDTDGGKEISPIEKDYNSVINITLPTSTKECNEFLGWDAELPERMPAHDITLKAIWEYTCSRSSGGGGGAKKSESTTREIAINTPTEQEHNSANEEQKSETSETSKTPTNGETTHQVISVTQEISEDGTPIEVVVETVKIKNTDIVATVRTEVSTASSSSSSSSSTTHTKEQNDAYSFAKSNGITTTSSIEDAKMNTELTRIQMAKMLSNFAINVLGQEPDPEKGIVKFNDVTNKMDKQYDNAVTKAYQLGIMGQNMKNNEFRPSDTVTRAEFASALSRLLYQTEEGEYKGTGKYYIPHVSKLYNEGIVNKTDPEIKEKRGYVMTMLMRTVQ